MSNFAIAILVALFSMAALLASLMLNGAARLGLPVTVPNSCQPLFCASSGDISPSMGPAPTLVTYDLHTITTSSTFFGPRPTSEQIADAVTSFDVTNG